MINNLESVFTREFAAILDRMLRSLFAKIEYYWRDCFQEKLTSFHVSSSHLAEMWDWEHVGKDCSIPAASRIRNVHCLNVFRQHGGIWIKWKQYLTSATWSDPILLIPGHRLKRSLLGAQEPLRSISTIWLWKNLGLTSLSSLWRSGASQ